MVNEGISIKILSLNVNNFAGLNTKESYKNRNKYSEWKALERTSKATEIFAYIQQKNAVIVILHEFELYTEVTDSFTSSMEEIGYDIVPYEAHNYKNPSITIMFKKKELLYKKLENPHNLKSKKNLRASVIKTADCIIYGVHVPQKYDSDFWVEIIDFYKKHKKQKLVIIGDLNVYDLGTEQKKKYLKLLALNAKDAWLEKGYNNLTSTHIKGKRLDYALVTPELYESLISIRIDSFLMNNNSTDHASLILEI